MLYVRGNKKDFDKWAAEGAKGWSYKDVLPYFKKMEDNRDKNYILNGKKREYIVEQLTIQLSIKLTSNSAYY